LKEVVAFVIDDDKGRDIRVGHVCEHVALGRFTAMLNFT
jgi:hypothetical protein